MVAVEVIAFHCRGGAGRGSCVPELRMALTRRSGRHECVGMNSRRRGVAKVRIGIGRWAGCASQWWRELLTYSSALNNTYLHDNPF